GGRGIRDRRGERGVAVAITVAIAVVSVAVAILDGRRRDIRRGGRERRALGRVVVARDRRARELARQALEGGARHLKEGHVILSHELLIGLVRLSCALLEALERVDERPLGHGRVRLLLRRGVLHRLRRLHRGRGCGRKGLLCGRDGRGRNHWRLGGGRRCGLGRDRRGGHGGLLRRGLRGRGLLGQRL